MLRIFVLTQCVSPDDRMVDENEKLLYRNKNHYHYQLVEVQGVINEYFGW